jgi:hypothetical protein
MPPGFSLCFTPRCLRLRVIGDTWEHCGAVAVLVAQGPNPPREVAPTAWDVHGVTALKPKTLIRQLLNIFHVNLINLFQPFMQDLNFLERP